MKQISDRYKVRENPYFHGYWCIIDRWKMSTYIYTNEVFPSFKFFWTQSRVSVDNRFCHFTNFDDAIEFIRLIELSTEINGM